MNINPFLPVRPWTPIAEQRYGLYMILEKRKYPCYAQEVEQLRQARMDSRLEWRRKRRDTMAKNRVIQIAWWYAGAVAVLGGVVLFSELARLTIWTVLR